MLSLFSSLCRHSLLNHDGPAAPLLFRRYSADYFPPADSLTEYLRDFAAQHALNIQYNTTVARVALIENNSDNSAERLFNLTLKKTAAATAEEQGAASSMLCRRVIVCTGLSAPHIPRVAKGGDLLVGYEELSLDLDQFNDKRVLIVGKGRSVFIDRGCDSAPCCAQATLALKLLTTSQVARPTSILAHEVAYDWLMK